MILLSIKWQKSTLLANEPKQTQTGQIVKLMSKLKDKIMSLPKTNDIKVLIMLLAKLVNKNWNENHTSIN